MTAFRDRLYLSTTAEDALELAREHGLGLEIAEYCTASNMDDAFPDTDRRVCAAMKGIRRFIFHAPYNELCPAAIDPRARSLALDRYRQAGELAAAYGIGTMVVHSGFIPLVYHPDWFIPRSVAFWRELLTQLPREISLCLENVMEPGPDMLLQIVREVDDPRFRLCLDVGHANTRVSSVPVRDWIPENAPFLSHVHLHNNDGDMDLHRCLGDGVLDMEEILELLDRFCPEATCTIENMTAADSVRWLGEHGYL